MSTSQRPLKFFLTFCVGVIIYFQLHMIPKTRKKTLLRPPHTTKSTWHPPKNVIKFEDCDVPCYFYNKVPLVGKKVVYDDRGRSSTFMHTMEGPKHYPRSKDRGPYDGLSTVSMKSDIPLPYFSWAEYNIMSRPVNYDEAIRGSVFIAKNCRSLNNREGLVRELQKYTRVDSVSSCLNNAPWPDHIHRSQKHLVMKQYLFYFAFENECSEDYMTEKLWGALEAGTLPVYYGAPNVLKYVPPHSIIDVNQFVDVETKTIEYARLGNFLNEIASDRGKYMEYHKWRFGGDYPEQFKRTYDFTHIHSLCRACRWNLARHDHETYSFDHVTQTLV